MLGRPLISANVLVEESPSGVIDGVNTTFTLTSTPDSGTLFVYLNGLKLISGVDFSLTGNTLELGAPPQSGDILTSVYNI